MKLFAEFKTYQEAQDELARVAAKLLKSLPQTDPTTPAGFVLIVRNPNPNEGGLHLLTNADDTSAQAWLAHVLIGTQLGTHEPPTHYPTRNPKPEVN